MTRDERMQNAINWAARAAHCAVAHGIEAHFIGHILAELRALDDGAKLKEPQVGARPTRPQRTFRVCVAQRIVQYYEKDLVAPDRESAQALADADREDGLASSWQPVTATIHEEWVHCVEERK